MSLNQMDDFTFKHSSQLDAIYTEYTANQIKSLFDSRGVELRTFINDLVTILNSANGAGNIGTSAITDLDGTTIQTMLQSIRDKLKNSNDGTSGADFINATAISGVNGNTVQSILEGLKTYADSLTASNIEATPIASGSGSTVQEQLAWLLSQIVIATTGAIVDGSIGEVKLSPTLLNKINLALSNEGLLSLLQSIDKSNLVNAINEVLTDLNNLAGTGRTTETVKGNTDLIASLSQSFTSHSADDTKHIDYAVASGTNTYTATITNITALTEGLSVKIKFTNANTGESTLNINSFGAISIKKGNGNALVSGNIKAGQICHLVYTGSVFQLLGEGGEYGTVTANDVRNTKTFGTDNGVVSGTLDLSLLIPSNIKQGVTIDGQTGNVVPAILTAGENQLYLNSAIYYGQFGAWTKAREVQITGSGTIRVKFSIYGDGATVNGQIYKNNIAVGTLRTTGSTTAVSYSEDIAVTSGDKIEIYINTLNSSYNVFVSNFGIYTGYVLPNAAFLL